eukprot:COSAG03_NODE_928_length_5279_cov_42.043243_3_plen_136_part_00
MHRLSAWEWLTLLKRAEWSWTTLTIAVQDVVGRESEHSVRTDAYQQGTEEAEHPEDNVGRRPPTSACRQHKSLRPRGLQLRLRREGSSQGGGHEHEEAELVEPYRVPEVCDQWIICSSQTGVVAVVIWVVWAMWL